MEYEALLNLQGYVKFFLILVVFVVFYAYAYSIYTRDKKGERDFEKYSNLVHDDSFSSSPLEERTNNIDNKEK
jgi:cytochrome c oxidase cbb3-type subunit 4